MRKIFLLVTTLILMTAAESMAWDIHLPSGYGQGEFKALTREVGSAIAYRNLAPAAPLGLTGFDVAVQASFIEINDEKGYWKTVSNDAPSYIVYPSLRVRKGLPLGIDVGVMYTPIADTGIKVYGAELSKAILEGGITTPALGVRATYTRLDGVSDVSLQTAGIDASISKGFLMLTPYAGAGMVWIDGKYDGNLVKIEREKLWQPRGFVGVKISPLPLVGVTAEVEYAVRPIYSLKLGVSF